MDRTRRTVGLYCALAFGVSWACIAAFHVSLRDWPPGAWLTALCALLGPLLAAILVQRGVLDSDVALPLGLVPQPTRWLFYAWGGAVLLGFAAFALSPFLPGAKITFDPNVILDYLASQNPISPEDLAKQKDAYVGHSQAAVFLGRIPEVVMAGAFMSSLIQLPVEAGFRGLVQRETAHLGFWRSSLITGLLQCVWVLPFVSLGIFYPGHTYEGLVLAFLVTLAQAPLLGYVRLRAGTVIASAIAIGTWNAVGSFASAHALSGSQDVVGPRGIAALVVLALGNVVLLVRGVAPAEEELRRLAADPSGASSSVILTRRG